MVLFVCWYAMHKARRHINNGQIQSTNFLKQVLNSDSCLPDNFPIRATTFSDFKVNILSTLMIETDLRPLDGSGVNKISASDNADGICEEIAERTRSLYLSLVSVITTAGRSFISVSSENGKGINKNYIAGVHSFWFFL
jgi:hypothetical protein